VTLLPVLHSHNPMNNRNKRCKQHYMACCNVVADFSATLGTDSDFLLLLDEPLESLDDRDLVIIYKCYYFSQAP